MLGKGDIYMRLSGLWKCLLVLSIALCLSSCGKDDDNKKELSDLEYTVTLYNDTVIVDVFEHVTKDTSIELPVLDKDGCVFVGWDENNITYYNLYTVTADVDLYASFEEVKDVFDVFVNLDTDGSPITITGYTGNATTLVIPQVIEGKIVESIGQKAFENSSIIEVSIPMDATIMFQAFLNSTSLQKVSFYGEYLRSQNDLISQLEYDGFLESNPSECVIVDGSIADGAWTFKEGCPILEVNSYEMYSVNEATFFTYNVEIDKNLEDFTETSVSTSFSMFAFEGAISLESIELKRSDSFIPVDMFKGCLNVTTIIVPKDNPYLTVMDGVLYNKEKTYLVYYPVGLKKTNFIIPSTVESVGTEAFFENDTIETISIPAQFTDGFGVVGLNGLREIIVDEKNSYLYVIDGVLFKDDFLIKYPAAMSGANYTVPSGTKEIYPYAFAGNQNLETIDLGNEVQHISEFVFTNVEKIEVLNIPASCISIGNNMIYGSSIETVIINRSATLERSITFQGGGRALSNRTMDNLKIYVPDGSIDAYLEDAMWMFYADYIYLLSEYMQ